MSFAKAIITPPKNVKKPFALCEASCDFNDKPICTIPNPSKIKPIALIAEKIKSDKLFMVASGSAETADLPLPRLIIFIQQW